MNKENNQKRWRMYGKINIFALIRGIPKVDKDNKAYYKWSIIDSLLTSFGLYIILVLPLTVSPYTQFSVLKSCGVSSLIIFLYSQTSNIIRIIYYREKWYTKIIIRYNIFCFSGYFIMFLLALTFRWV